MVRDSDVSPEQELNYLRRFTSGEPQDPVATLYELWAELERRFGTSAALTQALIKRP